MPVINLWEHLPPPEIVAAKSGSHFWNRIYADLGAPVFNDSTLELMNVLHYSTRQNFGVLAYDINIKVDWKSMGYDF